MNDTHEMALGRFEFLAMNNPFRQLLLRHWELPLFARMLAGHDIDLEGKRILDAGCGSGYSTKLLVETYRPSRIVAFDVMREQIALARRRGLDVDFHVGDLTAMEQDDASFDALFVFGVLHHIPRWQEALDEIARVLSPGGVALIEEPKARFVWEKLEEGMRSRQLEILQVERFCLGYFRSYLCCKRGSGAGDGEGQDR